MNRLFSTLRAPTLLGMIAFGTCAFAHDPDELPFRLPTPGTKPEARTCEELADVANYSADLSKPETKALKERCDLDGSNEPTADPAAKAQEDQK